MGMHLVVRTFEPGAIQVGDMIAWTGRMQKVISVLSDNTVTFATGDKWTFTPGEKYEVSEHEDPNQGLAQPTES